MWHSVNHPNKQSFSRFHALTRMCLKKPGAVHAGLNYSITCIQIPPKGSNESGLLQQVVFKYRFN